ncbi:MAG: NrfD/PsrC family molybdoenzyme membrane anchor subunit [Desulfomonilaceae bacterium]
MEANSVSMKPSWVEEELLLGMNWRDYFKSNLTPFNGVMAIILAIGLPVMAYRIVFGLGPSTNLSDYNPWGLWIGFDMLAGIAVASGGFCIATAVHILGIKEYESMVRPALVAGTLGYFFAVVGLIFDLGRYYRIYVPFFVSPGPNSILFLVALSVALYLHCQFFEWCPAIFEWLKLKRLRRWWIRGTLGLTVAGVLLTTGHQSALGSLFLLMPSKVHPLWYSDYISILFFVSAIYGGITMVIIESMVSHRVFSDQIKDHNPEHFDSLTLGLGKAAAVVIFAYLGLKLLDIAHGYKWGFLLTPYGYWYLVEVIGFVAVPTLILIYAVQNKRPVMVRGGAIVASAGVLLNRVNLSIVAFNWHLPWDERYVPSWMEVVITITIISIGLLTFRFIVNRMPILHDHPDFEPDEH